MDFENSHDDGYFAAEVRHLSGVCLARLSRIDEARARLCQSRGMHAHRGGQCSS